MRWGQKILPDGVQEFDYAYFWRFAWLPRWDNVNYRWVWLEFVAIRYYYCNMYMKWRKAWDGYSLRHKTCIYDCRQKQPEPVLFKVKG